MGHYDTCREGYCPGCGQGPGMIVNGDCQYCLKMRKLDMPSKTPKQKRFMAAAAHNPEFARKAGISQKVAKEFNQADAAKSKRKKKRKSK